MTASRQVIIVKSRLTRNGAVHEKGQGVAQVKLELDCARKPFVENKSTQYAHKDHNQDNFRGAVGGSVEVAGGRGASANLTCRLLQAPQGAGISSAQTNVRPELPIQ